MVARSRVPVVHSYMGCDDATQTLVVEIPSARECVRECARDAVHQTALEAWARKQIALFTTAMSKEILGGGMGEVMTMARSNLRNVPRP